MGHSPCPNPAGGGQGAALSGRRAIEAEDICQLVRKQMSRDTARGPDGRLVKAVEWYQLVGPPT
jgi:hypothetical protein